MNDWPKEIGNTCPKCDADRRYIELNRKINTVKVSGSPKLTCMYDLACNQCGYCWLAPTYDEATAHAVNLNDVWDEQREFNQLFRETPPLTVAERSVQTRDMVAGMIEEIGELIGTVTHKPHRHNQDTLLNDAATADQLSDIFKFWVSLCVIHKIDPNAAMRGFWRKSMVCRQRHSQEVLLDLAEPAALIDIDGVLCDYQTGFQKWIGHTRPELDSGPVFQQARTTGRWINRHDLRLTPKIWNKLKHDFRSSGANTTMPVYDDAREFLTRIRDAGLKIILLTSRPIDRYPNIFADTLEWLRLHDLPYDHVWWSAHKGDWVLDSEAFGHIVFAVDDDMGHVRDLADAGTPTYWLHRENGGEELWPNQWPYNNVTLVKSLSSVIIKKG